MSVQSFCEFIFVALPLGIWNEKICPQRNPISSGKLLFTTSDVEKGRKETKSWSISTHPIDIFNQRRIDLCKACFCQAADGGHCRQAGTPPPSTGICWEFMEVSRRYAYTLESYVVDKSLSTKIDIKHFKELLRYFDQNVKSTTGNIKIEDMDHIVGPVKDYFYLNEQYSTYQLISVQFMCRVLDRLLPKAQEEAYKETPLPALREEHLRKIEHIIKEGKAFRRGLSLENQEPHLTGLTGLFPITNLNEQERPIYEQYLKQLFALRNQKIYRFLSEACAKDLREREKNPEAPLTHLVTLESYDKDIQHKRIFLAFKVATAVAAVFFFFVSNGVLCAG